MNDTMNHEGMLQQSMAKVQGSMGTNLPLNQMQQLPRCECHECTQARWKMMFGGGGLAGFGQTRL